MTMHMGEHKLFCGYCANPVNTNLCTCFYKYNNKEDKNTKVINSIPCSQDNCSYLVAYNGTHIDVYCPYHLTLNQN